MFGTTMANMAGSLFGGGGNNTASNSFAEADHEHAPTQGAQAMQAAGNPAGAAGSGAMMSPGMVSSGINGGLAAAEDRQTTSQAMGNNFISKPQQAMGQDIFGGQSLPQKGMIGVAGMRENPLMMHKGKPHPNERNLAPPDNSRPIKPTRQEQKSVIMEDYSGKMKQQNDSLRKLKPTDKHYLPTFNKGTSENVDFYSDPKNKPKINAIRKLSKPLRDKTQNQLRNV